MVSLGDTAISLHIHQPSKPKVPIFLGGGGGVFWKVKTQSAKICLNYNGGGGCVLNQIPEQGCSEEFSQKILEA